MQPRHHDQADTVDHRHQNEGPHRADEILDHLVADPEAEKAARAARQPVFRRPFLEKQGLILDQAGPRNRQRRERHVVSPVKNPRPRQHLHPPPRDDRRDQITRRSEEEVTVARHDRPHRTDEIAQQSLVVGRHAEGHPARQIARRVGNQGQKQHQRHPGQRQGNALVQRIGPGRIRLAAAGRLAPGGTFACHEDNQCGA